MSRKPAHRPLTASIPGSPRIAQAGLPRALQRGATALALGSALLLSACLGESAQDLVNSAKTHLEKKD
ncbi:hypothetical protein FUT87_18450, partial [Mitsuaria sp. TWR114]|uniref:hypothetical protein n=1 Tax=Mitsuaria sp. TWR114 TaxID=2601731 RepID=UPI0011BDAD7B